MRSRRRTPRRCSQSAPAPCVPGGCSTMRIARWSRRSARASIGCRWRSSSPPTGFRLLSLPALLARLRRRLDVLKRGTARPAAAPALAASDARVVVGGPRRARAAAAVPAHGVRGRRFARRGGGRLPATTAGAEGVLGSLLDKTSLLRSDAPGQEPRFVMLDTVREFAAERAAGDPGDGGRGAPARALLRPLQRATCQGGGARAPARLTRASCRRWRRPPRRLRAPPKCRPRRRGAARCHRVRGGAAVGRAHARGPRLARGRP